MRLNPSLAKKNFPLRYWLLVALIAGVPNFIKFDSSGLTHSQGLFNPTSISSILLTLGTGFLLATVTLLSRERLMFRKVDIAAGLWIFLLLDFLVASLLQPHSQLTPFKMTDIPLAIYRLSEWSLAFALMVSLYTRETKEHATDLVIRVIATVCWIEVLLVWFVLPLAPGLVYASPGDDSVTTPRLGGIMIHPVHLAVIAGIAFFYTLIFTKGLKRAAGCFLAFATVALTYARSEMGILLILMAIYMLILARSTIFRWGAVLGGTTLVALGITFQEKVLKYLARGQGTQNITTLSERTIVWQASFRAIAMRPYLGYGYIAGAKNALRDQWNSTNWIPPHAHSEFIQAVLSGGYVAGALIVAIYGRALWIAIKGMNRGPREVYLLVVFLQVFLMAFIMPLVTVQFSTVSAIFLLTFVGLVAGKPATVPKLAKKRSPVPLNGGWRHAGVTGRVGENLST